MSRTTAFFVMFAGIIVTVAGVGGIEASMDDQGLMSAFAVSIVGGLISGCGVAGLERA
jgi:uncharacterized membrane protein